MKHDREPIAALGGHFPDLPDYPPGPPSTGGPVPSRVLKSGYVGQYHPPPASRWCHANGKKLSAWSPSWSPR